MQYLNGTEVAFPPLDCGGRGEEVSSRRANHVCLLYLRHDILLTLSSTNDSDPRWDFERDLLSTAVFSLPRSLREDAYIALLTHSPVGDVKRGAVSEKGSNKRI